MLIAIAILATAVGNPRIPPTEDDILPILVISRTISIIPLARNPGFTGREELLERLGKELSSKSCGQSKVALSGLGGVGYEVYATQA
jgi:hypothetical protein